MLGNVKRRKNVQEKAQEQFHRFARLTSIQGFHFIENSASKLEKSIWFLLILVMIALTAKDCAQTVDQYIRQPTSTKVTVMHNTSIRFREATLCIDIDTHAMDFVVDVRNATQVQAVLDHYSETADILQYLKGEVGRARNATDITDRPLSPWLTSLTALITNMLASVIRLENAIFFKMHKRDKQWGVLVVQDEMWHTDIETTRSIYLVYEYFTLRGVDFSELLQVTGALLCCQMNIVIEALRFNGKWFDEYFSTPCRYDQVTWLGSAPLFTSKDLLCMRLDEEFFLAYDYPADVSTIRLVPENIYRSGQDMRDLFADAAYIDFSGDRVVTSSSQNILMMPFWQKLTVGVEVQSYYRTKNLPQHPCTNELSFLDCRATCRAKYVAKNCNCWPLSWFDLATRLPKYSLCSQVTPEAMRAAREPFNDFNIPHISQDRCVNITRVFDLNLNCYRECLPSCVDKIFGFKIQDAQNSQTSHPNETFIRIEVNRFLYPYFEDFLVMDWQTLVSNLGGILGIWLGASFLALFHIIVFLLRLVLPEPIRDDRSPKGRTTCDVQQNCTEPLVVPYGDEMISGVESPFGDSGREEIVVRANHNDNRFKQRRQKKTKPKPA